MTLGRLRGTVAAIVACLVMLGTALWLWPPDLIRIGANYTAKTVCSSVLWSHRDADEVLESDVQAPGHPLLKFMHIAVDAPRGTVRAGLFGFIGGGLAVARPKVGCAVSPEGALDRQTARQSLPGPAAPLRAVQLDLLAALGAAVTDERLMGPGWRAAVVVHDGRIVAENYAHGFSPETRQLGWSMTKSVTAGIVGLLVQDGRLSIEGSAGLAGGGRERVTVGELLSMTSGLKFNESYGSISDVTRMLYLEPDMGTFAASQPLVHPAGEVWSYSSGTAVILARLVQAAAGADPIGFVQTRLFDKLGMDSAVIETDEQGTLVGSSYMYATPRDWARYGQWLAQDGVWQGERLLPPGYVKWMAGPLAASGGSYGHGMVWLRVTDGPPPGLQNGRDRLPDDTFWMIGHDGQYVAIVPSRGLVVVRMGLTPEREHYDPQPLVKAVLDALP